MKVLFVGDTPTVSTGFAACTRAACDALMAAGHTVDVLGINEWGDSVHTRRYTYDIYTCANVLDGGRDAMGVGRLPRLIDRLKPDIVVLLNDPWNVIGYFKACLSYGYKLEELPPFVGWLAVDSVNQDGASLNSLTAVYAWTQFAARELSSSGCKVPIEHIPLGVDTDVFVSRPQRNVRTRILDQVPDVPLDAFIVGAVGRNQVRKRLDLTIRYFANWIKHNDITDAYLLLHVAPTGEAGIDIQRVTNFYGIADRVLLRKPNIGWGNPLDTLVDVYNSLDVYVSTSQAEGWGLPALEAMACGVPCILPAFAAWDEHIGWPRAGAELVPVRDLAPSAPLNAAAFTLGGAPDEAEFIAALDRLYRAPKHRKALGQQGQRLAHTLTWRSCGQRFVAALESTLAATTNSVAAAVASQSQETGRVVVSG